MNSSTVFHVVNKCGKGRREEKIERSTEKTNSILFGVGGGCPHAITAKLAKKQNHNTLLLPATTTVFYHYTTTRTQYSFTSCN